MRAQYAAAGITVLDLGEGRPNHGRSPGSALRQVRRTVSFATTVARLCRIIRERDIDLIDGHTGPGNLVGVAAGLLTGTPCVVTTYNVEQWEPRWLWNAAYQGTLGLANAVITDSDAVAAAVEHFLIRRRRILVIPNGVVPPRSQRSSAEIRALFGLPADPNIRIVGQISSLYPTKGHMVLVEAARLVLDRLPNTAFLIVGFARNDPEYRERLQRRARELGIANRTVRIAEYPGEIGDVWKIIDVHAHPTLLDSLPNTIIEGMSLAKPAVVTAVGGIPTMVEHERTGLVVPPNDRVALADALVRILDDDAFARTIGSAAYRRYQAGYTRSIMTRRLETAFLELAT